MVTTAPDLKYLNFSNIKVWIMMEIIKMTRIEETAKKRLDLNTSKGMMNKKSFEYCSIGNILTS